jgi:hypothetical protein
LTTTCDFIVTIFDIGGRTDLNYSIRNLSPKSHFLHLDEKGVESVKKEAKELTSMLNFGRKMHLMTRKYFVVFTQQDQS